MEQSNLLLEQRNDSLKSSSEHNQARLLQAEQDKVSIAVTLCGHTTLLVVYYGALLMHAGTRCVCEMMM